MSGGKCVGRGAKNCTDGNGCTQDFCDALKGCIYGPAAGACNDGNACTTGELCKDSACGGGTVNGCDDGNVCTADVCDSKTGQCVSAPLTNGNKCGASDKGQCVAG